MPSHTLRSLRVLIVDDDPVIRTTFAEQLDTQRAITVVAAASGGRQAISLLMTGQQPVDVVLLDSDMPDMDGAQTAREIYRRFPKMPIVMFTVFSRDEMLTDALAEGVNGFITKDESTENVAAALLRASRGEPVMSSRPTEMLVNAYQSEQRRATAEARMQQLVNELPPRLQDIYTCLLEGLTNRRIARKLGISENTVRIYVSEVLHRLGHTSRTELIAAALGN
ncbi:response regulator transcription factor [Actinomyces viscosus]|uniref:response regulator transcription factor n=1 Tax=Actinomyces viscosus TaxID=1656 RepID=UPI0028E7F983|nr:response regulator transcription factor [Actinomyces viscosus]